VESPDSLHRDDLTRGQRADGLLEGVAEQIGATGVNAGTARRRCTSG
jgi:hypothetical protein